MLIGANDRVEFQSILSANMKILFITRNNNYSIVGIAITAKVQLIVLQLFGELYH